MSSIITKIKEKSRSETKIKFVNLLNNSNKYIENMNNK